MSPSTEASQELLSNFKRRGSRAAAGLLLPKGSTSTSEDGDACCAICLDAFVPGQRVIALPCGHVYHRACGELFLKSSACLRRAMCPCCRQPLFTDKELKRLQDAATPLATPLAPGMEHFREGD